MGIPWRGSLVGILFAGTLCAQTAPEGPLSTGAAFGTTVVIQGGLRGSVYLIPKDTTVLPDFEHDPVKSVGEIWTHVLNVPPRHWRSGFPGLTDRFEWFAIDYTGRFWISRPGRYTFALLGRWLPALFGRHARYRQRLPARARPTDRRCATRRGRPSHPRALFSRTARLFGADPGDRRTRWSVENIRPERIPAAAQSGGLAFSSG